MNDHAQGKRILDLLEKHVNEWVPLPMILDLKPRIAKYTNRICELRLAGHKIENKTEWISGVRHSWYMLMRQPVQARLFGEFAEAASANVQLCG